MLRLSDGYKQRQLGAEQLNTVLEVRQGAASLSTTVLV